MGLGTHGFQDHQRIGGYGSEQFAGIADELAVAAIVHLRQVIVGVIGLHRLGRHLMPCKHAGLLNVVDVIDDGRGHMIGALGRGSGVHPFSGDDHRCKPAFIHSCCGHVATLAVWAAVPAASPSLSLFQ